MLSMRGSNGWLIWHWDVGPLNFGVDLATWGFGVLQAFRYPRGFALHLGPFYLTVEGLDLVKWIDGQFERLDRWAATPTRESTSTEAQKVA